MNKEIKSINTFKIDSYIHNFKNAPILSKNEEFILTKKFKEKNDLNAIKQLIESNLKYIIKIAIKYEGYGIIVKDLIQEGVIGFIKSVKNFDPSKNIRLISFAIYWIKSEIHEYIIKNLRLVKIASTKSQKKLLFNLKKIKHVNWLSENEAKVISNLFNSKADDVPYMESRLSKYDVPLDFKLDEVFDSNHNFILNYEDDMPFILEKENWNSFLIKKLRDALKKLDERSKNILKERWLLKKKSTLKKLAERYNLSLERIRQLESSALKKVKVLMNLDCL
ncbi:MAG TPA: RNA polymerase factor sigma-32 [Candidatus Azoamicus sp. MARI]